MYNELVWRSFKKFNFEVQHTIVFTISIVNLKTLQRTPIFFQVYGIDCSKQIESSHVREENTWNDKSVHFIMDPHMPKAPRLGPGLFRLPLVTIQSTI